MKVADVSRMQPYHSSGADALASFVTAQNIELYKARLATEATLVRRKVLLELLANEFAKLPKTLRCVEEVNVDLS